MTARLVVTSLMIAAAGPAAAQTVLTYHNSANRQGAYIVPGLTKAAAATMRLDKTFVPSVSGNIYAQPLYWKAKGVPAELIVATENNIIYALNPNTGATLWQAALPAPVPASQLACGDIDPEGITGTPVIDPSTGTLYVDSLSAAGGTVQHSIYALSLANGSTRPGWPLNVQSALAAAGVTISPTSEGERSALLLQNGKVYATYGGRAGDCQPYNGTVIEIDPTTQALTGTWQTRAAGGGIWSQGGIAADSSGSLFVTTGNTSSTKIYGDGESVIRLQAGLAAPASTTDYYAPANWLTLDQSDLDLGGTEGVPVDILNGSGTAVPSVISFGKDGNAYLLNRANLGGVGGAATIFPVATGHIITAPAVYPTANGDMVAITNTSAVGCPGNVAADSVMMLQLAPAAGAPISVAWCSHYSGNGSPIITTSDGSSDPIVWAVGTQLHGFDVMTGAPLSSGHGATLTGVNRYATVIVVGHHLYVAANNNVYAFTFTPG